MNKFVFPGKGELSAMNQDYFASLCQCAGQIHSGSGIGTLGEKTLHAMLKRYFDPHEENHEVTVGGFVADIVGESGIIEIQTRQFDRLRKKLPAFLSLCPVTVVYPIPKIKWLRWIDPDSGEITARRKSPRAGTCFDVFYELYKIMDCIGHPNFSLCLMLLEMEEYRNLNGWDKKKKRGSTREERLPVALIEELHLSSPCDYAGLLPLSLPTDFTARDLKEHAKISLSTAQTALRVLYSLGAVERTGKKGRAFLYRINA